MQGELEGLHRARVRICGEGWGWRRGELRGGGVEGRQRKLGKEERWGMGWVRIGIGQRLLSRINDCVPALERGQQRTDLAYRCLYVYQAAVVGCLGSDCGQGVGGRRLTGAGAE
jgi:hypothetical protein